MVATHTLSGCPQASAARHLLTLPTPTADIITLLHTIIVHLPSQTANTVTVDMAALTVSATAQNGTIVLQWDVTGGGASVIIDTISFYINTTSSNSSQHGYTYSQVTSLSNSTPPPGSMTVHDWEDTMFDTTGRRASPASRVVATLATVTVNLLLACAMASALLM